MSYITTYARPLGDILTDFTCADPNSTKVLTKDKAGCFCNTVSGYQCSAPEDPFFGCMSGGCVKVASTPVDPSASLAERVCKEAGLIWDAVNGQCLQGGVAPAPGPGPSGGGGGAPGPQPQPAPVPVPGLQKASVNTQDIWLAVIVGGLVLGMVMVSKQAPSRARPNAAKGKFKKLATATSVERIQKYVNEYFYSTTYRVDPITLEITRTDGVAAPAAIFVERYRGGYLFGRRD